VSTDQRMAFVLAAFSSVAALAAAQDAEPARPAIIVETADGNQLPLQDWRLSYDYVTWAKGGSPALGSSSTKDASVIVIGKKSVPFVGSTLEIAYREMDREVEAADGTVQKVKVGIPSEITVRPASGSPVKLKVEVPDRGILLPDVGKDQNVMARSLDLSGVTLTGTRKTFCLVSFTSLVECGLQPADRVVRVRFDNP
jgi:hypothetical protein